MTALYTLSYYEEYYEDKCLARYQYFLHTLSTKQEHMFTARIPKYMYDQNTFD